MLCFLIEILCLYILYLFTCDFLVVHFIIIDFIIFAYFFFVADLDLSLVCVGETKSRVGHSDEREDSYSFFFLALASYCLLLIHCVLFVANLPVNLPCVFRWCFLVYVAIFLLSFRCKAFLCVLHFVLKRDIFCVLFISR